MSTYKQLLHINIEQQLKEEIEFAVKKERELGYATTLSSFVRQACLQKLGIINKSDKPND